MTYAVPFEQKDHFAPVATVSGLKAKYRALVKKFHPDKNADADPAIIREVEAQYAAYTAHLADGAAVPDFSLTQEQRTEQAQRDTLKAKVKEDQSKKVARLRKRLVKVEPLKATPGKRLPDDVTSVVYPYRVFLGAKQQVPADLFDYDFEGYDAPLAEPPSYAGHGDPRLEQAMLGAKYPEAVLMLTALIPRLDAMSLSYGLDGLTLWIPVARTARVAPALESLHLRYSEGRKAWYYPAVEYAQDRVTAGTHWQPSDIEQEIIANALTFIQALPAPISETPAEATVEVAPEAPAKAAKPRKPTAKKAPRKAKQPTA